MIPDMPLSKWIDIPPVWLVGALALVWLQAWLLPVLLWPFALAGMLGFVLFWGGLIVMAAAFFEFMRAKTTPVPHQTATSLITRGIFQLSRNPIYLGDAMILSSVIIWWGAWLLLPLVPGFVLLITRRFIKDEERRLKDAFGPEFAAWSKETRRWI